MFAIPNVRQTKFLLTAFVLTVATLAMGASMFLAYMGKAAFVTFEAWWQVCVYLFGLYAVADIVNTHLQQSKGVSPENQTA